MTSRWAQRRVMLCVAIGAVLLSQGCTDDCEKRLTCDDATGSGAGGSSSVGGNGGAGGEGGAGGNLHEPLQLALGMSHSCARWSHGKITCWGSNIDGQLGAGDGPSSLTPVEVTSNEDIRALASGSRHTCMVDQSMRLRCWGANDAGQLGNGELTASSVPAMITQLSDVAAVSAGGAHTCAVLGDGAVWCWGSNAFG